MNLIYRFVGNRTQARDLAQEVFIRVWQAAPRYKPQAKFTTWIYRITANLCLNELKSSGRKKLFFSESPPKKAGSRTRKAMSPHRRRIFYWPRSAAVKSPTPSRACPENQRMALILKRYDNLSYHEIAKIMECSVSAVESLLVRAKRNLQEKLSSSHEK